MADLITTPSRPSEGSIRMQHSCALCRLRKVKCDKKTPCTNCVKHNVACVSAETSNSRPRKKRFPEAELLARLRKYEAALTKLGIDPEDILQGRDPETDSTHVSNGHPQAHEAVSPVSETSGPYPASMLASYPSHAVHASLEQHTHRTKTTSRPKLSAYIDAQESVHDHVAVGLLFAAPSMSVDLPGLHPPLPKIFHLWQVFLDNVHPLLQIFHLPTLQPQILKAAADLSSTSLQMHALLLSIYAVAATAMGDEDFRVFTNEDRSEKISKYCAAAQCALHRANFMHSPNLLVLQAYVLYLIAVRSIVNPRSFPCLTGVAERIARRDGLNGDRTFGELTAFDAEMQRRVWWQIVLLDTRAAELSGSGLSMVDPIPHALIPLNVNESDLSPGADELPEARPWATDAIFVQIRCRVDEFFWRTWLRSSSPVNDDLAENLNSICDFEKELEANHLRNCDPRVPLHALAEYYAIYSIEKMKIWAHRLVKTTDLPAEKRATFQDDVIRMCTRAINSYVEISKLKSLERFGWFLFVTFPFLAYVHLFSNLRSRPTGDAADQAWKLLSVDPSGAFGRYKWLSGLLVCQNEADSHVGMQKRFASLAISAWEARQAVVGCYEQQPNLIARMKKKLGPTTARSMDQIESKLRLPLPTRVLLPTSAPGNSTGNTEATTQQSHQNGQDISLPLVEPRVEGIETDTWTNTEDYEMDQGWQNLFSLNALQGQTGWLEPFLP